MQKYLISILIWSSEPLCYINVFFFFLKGNDLTYIFQSLEMTSKAQKVTFLPVWLEQ